MRRLDRAWVGIPDPVWAKIAHRLGNRIWARAWDMNHLTKWSRVTRVTRRARSMTNEAP